MTCIAQRKVRTRKPHRCWGCCILIPAGTPTEITVGADMGEISTAYWCDICVGIMADMYDPENGLDYGDLQEEAEERRAESGESQAGGKEER